MNSIVSPLISLVLLAVGGGELQAQDFPTRTIKMIVPYPAGGLNDTVARVVGQRVSESLGQAVIIVNRPGGSGIGATMEVLQSPADAYTLFVGDQAQLSINPHLYSKLPYDPRKDLVAVSLMGTTPIFLVAAIGVPASNLQEVIALAKDKPGHYNYGSPGSGTVPHMAAETLKAAVGIDIVHIPFKGGPQSAPALLSGQVHYVFISLPSIFSPAKSGKVKLVAVASTTRSQLAPEVPTFAESGVPDYEFATDIGITVRAGTPDAVISKLSAEFVHAVKHPDVQQRLTSLGIEPVGSTPEAYAVRIRADYDRYARAVKSSGTKAD